MSDTSSGEKTEQATATRLRDARKQGDVAKSKDVTSTLVLAFAFAVLWFTFSFNVKKLTELLYAALAIPTRDFSQSLNLLGATAFDAFISISAALLIPIALFGLLVEFLQTGPVFTLKKVAPKLINMNPGNGFKNMFSLDNALAVLFSVIKTIILVLVAFIVIRSFLSELMLLPGSQTISLILAFKELLLVLMLWTIGIFTIMMLLDWGYQRFSYARKMRMSIREVRQEQKNNEGDPAFKHQRKQLHQEFSQVNHEDASRAATVLVVNPTHVAIAIEYHRENQPVPIVTAKGENELAAKMREAANENHVPVIRNELLARTLLANVDIGNVIPKEFFEVVAQIILWATKTTAMLERERVATAPFTKTEFPPLPPGENLTRYPLGFNSEGL